MKNILLMLTLTIAMTSVQSQEEKIANKQAAEKFENFYNKGSYENIFSLFSTEMQAALPLDKTKAFLAGMRAQAGLITKREFMRYDNGPYAAYKTQFEKSLAILRIAVNANNQISGFFVAPYQADNQPVIERTSTKLILPFNGSWNVFWGGDTKEQNYHVATVSQKNAFDILIFDKDGKSHKSDGKLNEDYYAFGKDIIAPCDAEVVLVVNGVKDNVVGEMNTFNVGGNMVILKTANKEFLVFCHFKHQSIKVAEGQTIKQGQLLGLCGNSGNSSEPHLHFHVQNIENMGPATGVKCYFDKIQVNGQLKTDYSPVKGDIIAN